MRAALLLAFALIGCSRPRPESTPTPLDRPCRTEALAGMIGRPATPELGREAQRISGASRVRWIRPGDAVTMDYSSGRLNIHLDNRNNVESFACG